MPRARSNARPCRYTSTAAIGPSNIQSTRREVVVQQAGLATLASLDREAQRLAHVVETLAPGPGRRAPSRGTRALEPGSGDPTRRRGTAPALPGRSPPLPPRRGSGRARPRSSRRPARVPEAAARGSRAPRRRVRTTVHRPGPAARPPTGTSRRPPPADRLVRGTSRPPPAGRRRPPRTGCASSAACPNRTRTCGRSG